MVNENGEEQRTRGHSLDIYKPRSKLDMITYFFSSKVTEQWNKLPNARTIKQFKNEYDK